MGARNVQIRCSYSFGDIVALTGAVRELQLQYPHKFKIDVKTSYPELWQFNPHIEEHAAPEIIIDCDYVPIDRTGKRGWHYVEAYLDLINCKLGTSARMNDIRGDVYLSAQEKDWYSEIYNYMGEEIPFWIVCSGGKFDIPIKWWDHARYQQVVDHFRGRIQFVQIGAWGNHHPRLKGTIDLRGRTKIRDLIHLVYYSQGVFCGVTALMHLAAAVPTEHQFAREGIIIGGLREPAAWEAYPGHRYFVPKGKYDCQHCWKQRYFEIPDRGGNSDAKLFCSRIQNELPACMDAISGEAVIECIEKVLVERHALKSHEVEKAERAIILSEQQSTFDPHNITPLNAAEKAAEFLGRIRPYPKRVYAGRGVVICGGGASYFTNAWVNIQMLRRHGCNLPIEVWHLGRHELDPKMEALLEPLGARCVNARKVMNRHPMRNPLGWELKSYALLHCRFEEVLFLDADNVAVRNPEYLFETAEYKTTGAIFWPDYQRLSSKRAIWKLCGVTYRDEPEFESGQIVVNKEKCWRELNLSFWYNDHSEFFYQYIHGDKETFHMAWRRTGQKYSMPSRPIFPLVGTMCQHDFEGRRIFQHRNLRKWNLHGENERISGFEFEEECLAFLNELRGRWDGRVNGRREVEERGGIKFRKGSTDRNVFENVRGANEYKLPAHFEPGDVILDIGGHIGSFALACHDRGSRKIYCFEADRENFVLARENLRGKKGISVFHKAVLNRECRTESGPYPADKAGINAGGANVRLAANGRTRGVPLDTILKKFERVRLLKLDCEGSEWPILIDSKELHRVEGICGEYHEMEKHELCPGGEALNRGLLQRLLRARWKRVKTVLDRTNPKLGKFWASVPKKP
jgi:FkbM family methyltransferase